LVIKKKKGSQKSVAESLAVLNNIKWDGYTPNPGDPPAPEPSISKEFSDEFTLIPAEYSDRFKKGWDAYAQADYRYNQDVREARVGRQMDEYLDLQRRVGDYYRNRIDRSVMVGGIIGAVVGIIGGFTLSFGILPIALILGLVVGFVCKVVYSGNYKKFHDGVGQFSYLMQGSINYKQQLLAEHQDRVSLERFMKDYVEPYKEAFYKAAVTKSLDYVGSPVVEQIADRLVDVIYEKEITPAERGAHVEVIERSVSVEVSADRIEMFGGDDTPLDVFNFEKERCSNLETGLQMAALAKAVGQQMELVMMERHPEDPCGSPASFRIGELKSNYLVDEKKSVNVCRMEAKMVYTPANMNYKPVQNW